MTSSRTQPGPVFAAASNARALVETAQHAAGAGNYGIAAALEVLALEEAAKAQVLGMRWIASSANLAIDYHPQLLDGVLRNSHEARHAFVAVQTYKRQVFDRLGSIDPFQRDARDPVLAESRLLKHIRWLNQANALKNRGLYVDPQGRNSRVSQREFEEAAAIVEPYVEETMRSASSLVGGSAAAKF